MTARGLFVTGTDTDAGKTVVAAALLARLRARGLDAVPMKPVQTGATRADGAWRSPDLDFCLRMAMPGCAPARGEYEEMAPFLLEPACSPHLAARSAGIRVSLDRIEAALRGLLSRHALVVAEGAGGLLVPLDDEGTTNVDLIRRLGLPVVVAARPGLGTINHTLLTLREARRQGLELLGVVFCDGLGTGPDHIAEDNARTIERLGDVRVLGRLPHLAGLADGRVSPAELARVAARHVTLPEGLPR